jgi:hypothetical protein
VRTEIVVGLGDSASSKAALDSTADQPEAAGAVHIGGGSPRCSHAACPVVAVPDGHAATGSRVISRVWDVLSRPRS